MDQGYSIKLSLTRDVLESELFGLEVTLTSVTRFVYVFVILFSSDKEVMLGTYVSLADFVVFS
jgi:hypothetical protein